MWDELEILAVKSCTQDFENRQQFMKWFEERGIIAQSDSWMDIIGTIRNMVGEGKWENQPDNF